MYVSPSAMEPLFPSPAAELKDLALELAMRSSELAGRLAEPTRQELCRLLKKMNCYYSNLIEGRRTTLADIDRAMLRDFDQDEETRALQHEATAHIEVEVEIDALLAKDSGRPLCRTEFICFVHREFYSRMPEKFRFARSQDGVAKEPVAPGEIRTQEVKVGRHLAPAAEALPSFLQRYESAYDFSRIHGDDKLLAIAAGHHRLAWIHPFSDGNGRVTRLLSYALLCQTIRGHGLWSLSRGLARRREEYYAALAVADATRQGDYDGRGNLSQRGLNAFVRFFLDVCLDQASFMAKLLDLGGLYERVAAYADLRAAAALPGQEKLRSEAKSLLLEILLRGEVPRGEAGRITGLDQQVARKTVIAPLLQEKLLLSDSHKAPLRLGLPARFVPYAFPEL